MKSVGGHVTQIGEYRNVNRSLVGSSEGNGSLEDRDVDLQSVLKLMFSRKDGRLWTGFNWLRKRASDGLSRTRQ
jgi:hypothetical protein